MNKYQIACVIVTYNRKNLLKNCLDAVASQTFKPHTVYITDNASTDGTLESVKEWGYYECERDEIRYKYVLNTKNEGGAGGFYLGMKTAYEEGIYDGLWVMDDDGVPSTTCLVELQQYLSKYHFISPAVLSIDNKQECAFFSCDYNSLKSKRNYGIIENVANPFNGVLFSRTLIANIGYPKREMFIWGDEVNYQQRATVAGFKPIMVTSAIHYHPKDRQKRIELFGDVHLIVDVPDWKLYCYIRNMVYNTKIGASVIRRIYRLTKLLSPYLVYYSVQGKLRLIIKATNDGLREDFTNLSMFLCHKK